MASGTTRSGRNRHRIEATILRQALSADQLTLQSLRRFDVAPHFVFAYRKTGLLVTVENETFMSEADLMRWDAAMLEYFQIERKTKAGATSSMRH